MPDRTHELHGLRQGLEGRSSAHTSRSQQCLLHHLQRHLHRKEEHSEGAVRYPLEQQIAYRHRKAYMEGHGIARDTHCPLCKDADCIGHILGSCTHSEVKKVYISRHDKAMRLIMKEIQNGSLGNFYCTADAGTAAQSKRLPEWLITPNTMQKCEFSPENKQKLRQTA
jgi:hypothetical protein